MVMLAGSVPSVATATPPAPVQAMSYGLTPPPPATNSDPVQAIVQQWSYMTDVGPMQFVTPPPPPPTGSTNPTQNSFQPMLFQ